MNTPPRFLQHLIGLECYDAYLGIDEVYVIVDVIQPCASTKGDDPGGPIDVVLYDSERCFQKKDITLIMLTLGGEQELFRRIGHTSAGRL